MGSKKSFVLYFDAYRCLIQLPVDQRGELITALFEYAREAAERPEAEPGELLARHPAMTAETWMAFSFLAETIRRDTEKWREKHTRYAQAALRREREPRPREREPRPRERGEELRRFLRQMHQPGPPDAGEARSPDGAPEETA